jgi:hypothetical protein
LRDADAFDRLAVLKIFAEENLHAGPTGGRPQHGIPEADPVHRDGAHGLAQIGRCRRLNQHDRSPAVDKGGRRAGFDPGFSGYHTEGFTERLQRLDAVAAPNRSLEQMIIKMLLVLEVPYANVDKMTDNYIEKSAMFTITGERITLAIKLPTGGHLRVSFPPNTKVGDTINVPRTLTL